MVVVEEVLLPQGAFPLHKLHHVQQFLNFQNLQVLAPGLVLDQVANGGKICARLGEDGDMIGSHEKKDEEEEEE